MTSYPKTQVAQAEEVESTTPSRTVDVGDDNMPEFDDDDIHQAALADNPAKAEKLSWTTYLAIGVCWPFHLLGPLILWLNVWLTMFPETSF